MKKKSPLDFCDSLHINSMCTVEPKTYEYKIMTA